MSCGLVNRIMNTLQTDLQYENVLVWNTNRKEMKLMGDGFLTLYASSCIPSSQVVACRPFADRSVHYDGLQKIQASKNISNNSCYLIKIWLHQLF